jgi:hypothetical protein
MDRQTTIGRILLAVALTGFAVQHLGYAMAGALPRPGPPWVIGFPLWTGVMGVVLFVAGLSLAMRYKAEPVAGILGVGLAVYACALHLPTIISQIRGPAGWTNFAELLALAGVLVTLSVDQAADPRRATVLTIGRLLYGVPLVVFAAQHFIYANFVAGLVPNWIPWHLFWAWFVGAAFIAAGAGIVTGRLRWWAATLLGTQFLLWVVVLHAPRVAAAPQGGNEWTSLFVALAMGAGAWVLAGPRRPAEAQA